MRVIGVDEAGRGPILGPMVVAAVALEPRAAEMLAELGVADSKRFGASKTARTRRAELAAAIDRLAEVASHAVVTVEEIDRHAFGGQLNALERKVARELLERIRPGRSDRIMCDGARIFGPLRARFAGLEAVDRGESAHVAVAAASIVAKHVRDEAFAVIVRRYEAEFGPIGGGGYPNAATRRFLDAYARRHGRLPPEARRSWGAPKDLVLVET
jgi:ribonuclease HII